MQKRWLGSILDYSIDHHYKSDANFDTSGEPCSTCLRAMVNDFIEGDEELSARDDAFNNWYGGLSAGAAILRRDSLNVIAGVDGRTSSYKSAYCTCGKNASIAIKELEWVLQAAAKGVEPELQMEIEKTMQEMKGLHLWGDRNDEGTTTSEARGEAMVAKLWTQKKRKELKKHPRTSPSSARNHVLIRLRDRLRTAGYDAGICKSEVRSISIDGVVLMIGGHEYVDVVTMGLKWEKYGDYKRVMVDVGFREHFEIARPSAEYERMKEMLPETYVGSGAALGLVVRIMCAAARESMGSEFEGIYNNNGHGSISVYGVPPWRRLTFLQSKWSHRYTRTLTSSSTISPPATPAAPWKPPPPLPFRPSPPAFGPGALSRALACIPHESKQMNYVSIHTSQMFCPSLLSKTTTHELVGTTTRP